MKRARRTRRITYLVYLLVVLGGFYLLYKLVPAGVIDLVRATYLGADANNP